MLSGSKPLHCSSYDVELLLLPMYIEDGLICIADRMFPPLLLGDKMVCITDATLNMLLECSSLHILPRLDSTQFFTKVAYERS